MLPLEGITIISIEQAVAAPFATRQLADLGARVIEIERPDVVDERILGLDQHDLDFRVEGLGDVDAPVAASDDDDGRPALLVLVHIGSSVPSCN